MRRAIMVGLLAVLLAGVLVAGVLVAGTLLRSSVRTTSTVDTDVTIECTASTGGNDGICRVVGDNLLRDGPPSFTFDIDDVSRITFSRSWFGLGTCSASWFTPRYPDDPVWTQGVSCALFENHLDPP